MRAFLWNGVRLSDLGTLGGSSSDGEGINDAGEVAGVANLPGAQVNHGFLWRNGVMTDLGTLDGDPCSAALSINSKGQVVGASESVAGGCNEWTTAFLWENGGPIVDLNTLVPSGSGVHLFAGFWTNDRGEIVAGGSAPVCNISATCGHAYVLIPCDENHPDILGCDYSLVAATTSAQVEPPQNTAPSAPTNAATLSPAEVMTRFRSLGAGRNRRYGVTSPKATMNGQAAVSARNAALSPTSLTFSTQAIGTTSAAKTVTLKNTGSTSLTIAAVAIVGTNAADFPQTHNCGSSLAAGATCSISVTFKPTTSGTRAAALSISDNAPGSPEHVALGGVGTTAELSPTSLSFGTVAIGTTSQAKTMTLTNVGATALTISGIAMTGINAGDFAQTHTCGSSLAAGAGCSISVMFKPTASGARSAALTITDNAAGSPQHVPLGGIGTTAKLFPTSLNFGTVAIGTTSPAKTVTLTNVGATAISIAGIAVTGINAGDFAQTQIHTCGSSLAAGASCSISITFKPTASGTRTAALSVSDNAAGSPQTVTLNGNCIGGKCGEVGQECGAPQLSPCCPGLVCVPASTRAFCEL